MLPNENNKNSMERQLTEIVEKYLEGNYLVGSENKAKMISEILLLFSGVGRSEQLKAFVDEFIEAWEDGNGGDSDLYRKAKSL